MAGVHSPEGWGVPQLKDEWMNIPSAPRVPQAHKGDLVWQPPVQMGLSESTTSVKGILNVKEGYQLRGRKLLSLQIPSTGKKTDGAFMDV